MTTPSLPTREQEQELHRRLLEWDKLAPLDLADAYYSPLLDYLRRRNLRQVPEDMLADAASETWVSLCKNPKSYDGKGSLWAYLRMSAQRDLMNTLAKETRRRRHIVAQVDVEQLPGNGKILTDDADMIAEVRREILPGVQAGLTDGERRCLELFLDGERKTARYAEVLGITDRPLADQKAEVKRVKDKLKIRIKRARRDHEATP
jgi:RNA polymerase sigma factor (sigma-70 family)